LGVRGEKGAFLTFKRLKKGVRETRKKNIGGKKGIRTTRIYWRKKSPKTPE